MKMSFHGLGRKLLARIVVGCILCLVFALIIIGSGPRKAEAGVLGVRSVVLSTNQPAQIANHLFSFGIVNNQTIGSIAFEYCDNSPVLQQVCNPPSGLDASAAILSSQTLNTGFAIDSADTTANKIVISRAPLAAALGVSQYSFDNIKNPLSSGQTVYIRITTYPTSNGSGNFTDGAAVAFVTSYNFNVNAFVPPFLQLCVGVTVSLNCSTISGDNIDVGTLSHRTASGGTSQLSIGSNSISGYAVYALGNTMTSGNNIINALNSPSVSLPGNDQFGINLRHNSVSGLGTDPFGPGTGTPQPNYDTPNFYMFSDGDQIAGSPISSDYTRLTVTYLVNVSPSQPAGVYAATITYLGIANF